MSKFYFYVYENKNFFFRVWNFVLVFCLKCVKFWQYVRYFAAISLHPLSKFRWVYRLESNRYTVLFASSRINSIIFIDSDQTLTITFFLFYILLLLSRITLISLEKMKIRKLKLENSNNGGFVFLKWIENYVNIFKKRWRMVKSKFNSVF